MTNRTQLIQLIHIGAPKLFSDDEERRAWQHQHTGKTSCKDMTDREMEYLVKLLRDAGAITKRPPKRAGRVPFNRSPYMSKIEAMLAEMQLSWQYAESIAWRLTGGNGDKPHNRPGVQRLEWLKKRQDFEGLIAALEKEQTKRRYLASIELGLEALELDEAYVIDLLKQNDLLTDKWKRNLRILKMLAEHLQNKWNENHANR
tara:strand:- start:58083 stop:58688 length:606 start_codon:yes stop_codon:yes gene_type:complete